MDVSVSLPHVHSSTPAHRVLVTTIPKSGTYLLVEVLKELGYSWSGMHLFETGYTDYSNSSSAEDDSNSEPLHRDEDLSQSTGKIVPGSFAVGHLECKRDVIRITKGFKRLFLHRELRTCLVSWMRYWKLTKRTNSAEDAWVSIHDPREQLTAFLKARGGFMVKRRFAPMIGWLYFPGTLLVRFDDLTDVSERGPAAIEEIARFLDVPHCDAGAIVEKCLSADTITRSPSMTRLDDYWSLDAEDWFIANGGAELNRRLGYDVDLSVIPGFVRASIEPAA